MPSKGNALLIILGTLDDPHVARVSQRTSALGLDTLIVDHNERIDLTIGQRCSGEVTIAIGKRTIDPYQEDVVVWNRSKLRPRVPFFFPHRYYDVNGTPSNDEENEDKPRLTDRTLTFLAEQWRATFQIFLRLFEEFTVNNVVSSARIENKLIQQIYAAKAGFLIPETLLTNQISLARKFVGENGAVVKALGKPDIGRDPQSEERTVRETLMTMPLSTSHLRSTSNTQFRLVPSFIQRNIRKSFELRVVYIDRRVFAFRIPSQDFEITSVDWRFGNYFLEFEYTDLPKEVEERLSTFMDLCGLVTGAADLIVDREGEYWFLEVNPSGAWMWLDPLVNGAIGEAFAQFFVSRLALGTQSNAGEKRS